MLLSKEERQSLRRDLVDPVKGFLDEVQRDTVGDAKRYYAARARKAEQEIKRAREKTREQMAAIRREQEELKKQRRRLMKRAAIVLALLAFLSLVVISVALNRGF